MSPTNHIMRHLCHALGSRREVEQYVHEFTSVAPARFAMIKVGGGIIDERLEELTAAIAFLRRLDLIPVIVHGAGPQLNRELEARGIDTKWEHGIRVTDRETLAAARHVFDDVGTTLADALDADGVRARVVAGVFEAAAVDPDRLGYVGDIVGVRRDPIERAVDAGIVPIVSSLGASPTGQLLNVNADVAARELAAELAPTKVIFLTPTGGLLDADGKIIPAINLAEDYDDLLAQPWVSGGMARKLMEIRDLVARLPDTTSVSITSSAHLARELFTHRGEGTLVRRGMNIFDHSTLDDVDAPRLRSLLEESFGRPLVAEYPAEGRSPRALLAGDYTAVALVREDGPAPYLDKFAVNAQAQGIGIGSSLWSRLRGAYDCLVWRSRPDNPVNAWYLARADGMRRTSEWLVFWYGLESPEDIEAATHYAAGLPVTFLDGPVPAPAVTSLPANLGAIACPAHP